MIKNNKDGMLKSVILDDLLAYAKDLKETVSAHEKQCTPKEKIDMQKIQFEIDSLIYNITNEQKN